MTERVVVLTRVRCHLCADACAVVERVASAVGTTWATVDVDADPELAARWGEYVPVVLVDGEVHDWFRVDESRLTAALTRPG